MATLCAYPSGQFRWTDWHPGIRRATGVLSFDVGNFPDANAIALRNRQGWCRELWLKSLGLKAVLPPPEEKKDVKTAIEAAQAEQEAKSARHR